MGTGKYQRWIFFIRSFRLHLFWVQEVYYLLISSKPFKEIWKFQYFSELKFQFQLKHEMFVKLTHAILEFPFQPNINTNSSEISQLYIFSNTQKEKTLLNFVEKLKRTTRAAKWENANWVLSLNQIVLKINNQKRA